MVLSVPLPLLTSTVLLCFTIFLTLYFVLRDVLLALPWPWQAFALNKAGDWHFTQYDAYLLGRSDCFR